MNYLGTGSVVLNQSPKNPMSGEVIHHSRTNNVVFVKWVDGALTEEHPSDLTLTGQVWLQER